MEYKYKKGDKIVCINSGINTPERNSEYGGGGWEEGKVYTIDWVANEIQGQCILWTKGGKGIWDTWVRPHCHVPEELFKL